MKAKANLQSAQRVKASAADRAFMAITCIFIAMIAAIILYPCIYVIAASLSDPMEVTKGHVVFLPKKLTLSAYVWVLGYKNVLNSYRNTVVYTVVGTMINLVMTTLCAYPLSKPTLHGRRFLTMMITFTMLFGGGMIPTYLLVKELGMLDSMWALVIPGAIGTWNMFIMKNYFQTSIPREILEAARIDGAGEVSILARVVLPLSLPIIAVMIITYACAHWNSYFAARIYMLDQKKYPLQLVLNNLLSAADLDGNSMSTGVESSSLISLRLMLESMKYAACVIATLPILCIFPLVQRYFEKGIMLGAIKG